MNVLGIETSCDETATAVISDESGNLELLSNVIASQIDLHKAYGGVVPEIAARSHIETILPVVKEALNSAFPDLNQNEQWSKIDAIAVTKGPGLLGSLLIGGLTAKTLALVYQKPLYGVDHVLSHLLANMLLKPQPKFPILGLIVSGGHSQIVLFENQFKYQMLGKTVDDAVGEAFDKVAKIVGLPYPGGPSIEKLAGRGNKAKYHFTKPKLENPYDMSFSGLKTAVLRQVQALCGKDYNFPSSELSKLLDEQQQLDIVASFQNTAIELLVDRVEKAYQEFSPASVCIGGGVAASQELRRQLTARLPIKVDYLPMSLCTDNAGMIATLGYYSSQTCQPDDPRTLELQPNLKM